MDGIGPCGEALIAFFGKQQHAQGVHTLHGICVGSEVDFH